MCVLLNMLCGLEKAGISINRHPGVPISDLPTHGYPDIQISDIQMTRWPDSPMSEFLDEAIFRYPDSPAPRYPDISDADIPNAVDTVPWPRIRKGAMTLAFADLVLGPWVGYSFKRKFHVGITFYQNTSSNIEGLGELGRFVLPP